MSFPMSRAERRAAEEYMRRENQKWPATMKEWPRADWPQGSMNNARHLLRVFRSNEFLVQEFSAPHPALVRLSINRTALDGHRWQDGLSWEQLQAIKDECGYAGHDAVEVFPRSADVVNVANMRHLWVLAEPLTFAWAADGGARSCGMAGTLEASA